MLSGAHGACPGVPSDRCSLRRLAGGLELGSQETWARVRCSQCACSPAGGAELHRLLLYAAATPPPVAQLRAGP